MLYEKNLPKDTNNIESLGKILIIKNRFNNLYSSKKKSYFYS